MVRKRIWLLWVIAALGFYSCQKEDAASKTNPVDNSPGGSVNANVNKTTLLQLVNTMRQSGCTCGLTVMPPVAPVTWNDQLATAALNHSNDMSSNNYFSHTSLNGSNAGDRITAAGYVWRAYGENIARGYFDEQAVMTGWLSSDDHCKNIMSPLFKEMGVARVGSYWSQEFGSR